MIDWYFVFTHSLWIAGLSVALAAVSYHEWLRKELRRPLRQHLREPSLRSPLNAGILLVAAALVLLEGSRWWERALWLLIGCLLARAAWTAKLETRAVKDRR